MSVRHGFFRRAISCFLAFLRRRTELDRLPSASALQVEQPQT